MNPHTLDVLEFSKWLDILVQYAITPLGREKIRRLQPDTVASRIQRALQQTTEMRYIVESRLRVPLTGIHDLRVALRQAKNQGIPYTVEELAQMRQTLEMTQELALFMKSLSPESYPCLNQLTQQIQFPQEILLRLQQSLTEELELADQASPKLAEIRKTLREEEASLRGTIETLQHRYAKFLQTTTFSLRNDYFVLPVRQECRGQVRGLCLDQSKSGETLFIVPQEMVLLSNHYQDLKRKEREEITRILWEFTRDVLAKESELSALCRVLGVFDLIHAKARMSLDFAMSEPQIDSPYLQFSEARHPLLMWHKSEKKIGQTILKNPQEVCPLDIHLGDTFDLLMITGPNTGGKTMVLKTVGILSLMALSGSHLPIKPGGMLPLFSQIHADIGDEQSLSQSLSTFSGHIKNIIDLLKQSTTHTLVLLDELGAGTDPDEGAALGTAILEQLLKDQAKVMVSTHLSPLKNFAYHYPRAENACVDFDPDSLKPTYRLLIGMPGNSNALHIASQLGLPQTLIEKAHTLVDPRSKQEKKMFEQLQQTRLQTEDTRLQVEQLKEETEGLKSEIEAELKEVQIRKKRIEEEANAEIERKMREVLQELSPILARLKNVQKSSLPDVEALQEVLSRQLQSTPLAQRRLEFIKTLEPEDQVYLPQFKQNCRVKKIDHKKQLLKVQLKGMLMDLPFEQVSWVEQP
jgi:DNA mismatch repair protein MutS2